MQGLRTVPGLDCPEPTPALRQSGLEMPRHGATQHCRSCGAQLARDNAGLLCAGCARRAHEAALRPPELPLGFWDTEEFKRPFSERHIGLICRAYREHPSHQALFGRGGIPQSVIGAWLGLTQAQVSRIETGPPIRNLDTLTHWARTLHIPQSHLWFELPANTHDENFWPADADTGTDDFSSPVVISQNEWRFVRRYLNRHRSTLAGIAARLYQPEMRLEGTPLLARPGWIAARPIRLDQITLRWVDGPQPAAIDGTEPEARLTCPLRTQDYRYERYTSAIRYLDSPALFENRPSYRLLDLLWSGDSGRMSFGLATYFDKLDISEALGHEFAEVWLKLTEADSQVSDVQWKRLPLRRLIGDPFDLQSRNVVPAITTLTLCRDRARGTSAFLLHWRDPEKVATAGGLYDVIPAGEFQPSSVAPWDRINDFDLWRNIAREFSEELLGTPEHDGSRSAPIDYDRWPFYRSLERARGAGKLQGYCFGVGFDALTLAATIPTVVVIDADTFEEIFGEAVRVNAEGVTVRTLHGQGSAAGIPFTEENVKRLLSSEPMASPGAACLALAWQHRRHLLNDES